MRVVLEGVRRWRRELELESRSSWKHEMSAGGRSGLGSMRVL
jgi:hypothetical protein